MATRKRRSNRDHARKLQRPSISDEVIEAELMALLTPAIDAQQSYYRQMGLRNRILTLPLMMSACIDSAMASSTQCARTHSFVGP